MDSNKTRLREANPIGVGMLFGAAIGVVIWVTTDLFVFFPVMVGIGMTLGAAWGQSGQSDGDDGGDGDGETSDSAPSDENTPRSGQ